MAGSIKGITIEFRGDTTKLTKAIGEVKRESNDLQKDLKAVDRELKFNPTSVTLWSQKQEILTQKIGSTKEKLGLLKQQQAHMDTQGVEKTSREYMELEREIVKAENQVKYFEKELRKLGSAKLQALGSQFQQIGGKMQAAGRTLTQYVTGPLVAMGAVSAKKFAEVDKTMQLTNKTMQNSEGEAKLLNKAMKDAAANSTFGMNDAATASLNFARAGLDAKQAAATLAPAMNLAAGEGGNLDTVSAGLVATINGFGDSFDKAGDYADVFAAACNNSALDIDSLSSNISKAVPVFKAAGYDVKDLTMAMGIMGNNGIAAEASATALKTGMARLVAPAKAGAEALSALGFGTNEGEKAAQKLHQAQNKLEEKTATLNAKQLKYNEALAKYGEGSSQAASAQAALIKAENDKQDASSAVALLQKAANEDMASYGELLVDDEGNMRSFNDVIGLLHKSFSGLSKKEQIAAAANIFGKNQMEKWLTLINTAPKDVDKLTQAIAESSGTTDEMSKAMMSGFGGSLEKLKSSIDVAATSFGEALAPAIQKVADWVQKLVDWFNNLSPEAQSTIATIAAVAAALGPLLVILGTVTSKIGVAMQGFSKLIGTMKQLNTAASGAAGFTGKLGALFGGISAPVLAVVAAIGVLVAAFVYLWKTNEGFRKTVTAAWNKVKASFFLFYTGIKSRLEGMGVTFKSVAAKIKKVWAQAAKFLAPVFETAFSVVATIVDTALKTIMGVIDVFIALFKGDWKGLFAALGRIFRTQWNGLVNIAKSLFSGLKKMWDVLLSWFGTSWKKIWTNIKSVGAAIWGGIKSYAKSIWEGIKLVILSPIRMAQAQIKSIVGGIKAAMKGLSAVKTIVSNAFNGAKLAAIRKLSELRHNIRAIIEKIKNFFPLKIGNIFKNFKLPHLYVYGGQAPYGIGGYGSLPSFDVQWYKNGGIFRSPTILGSSSGLKGVGEAGAEAVLPLDLLWSHMAQMADSIVNGVVAAQAIGAAGGGRDIVIPIYLYPSGPKMGEEVVKTYDKYKKVLG